MKFDRGIGDENLVGFYSAIKYFQSLENDNNKKFVEAFKAKYGPKSVIGDVTQAAYLGPWLSDHSTSHPTRAAAKNATAMAMMK